MRQRDPEFGVILPREDVARVIGIDVEKIASEWPCQVISTGLPYAIVPFHDSQTLVDLKSNSIQGANLLKGTGARFFYFLSLEPREGRLAVRARMFFYGGEDPATGSAAGCAASWLVRYGLAKSDEQVVIHQGAEAGRPSEIFVRGKREGERATDIRVGGYAVEVLRGTVSLSSDYTA
jgi:trans-2,3-dihydro-3-hydroxyanthranilate isomerase